MTTRLEDETAEEGAVGVFRAFRCAGKLSPAGHRQLDVVLGMCCGLYNAMLEEFQTNYRRWLAMGGEVSGVAKPKLKSYFDFCKELTSFRAEIDGWSGLSSRIPRGVAARFVRARDRFLGGQGGYPRFRARRRWRSIAIEDPKPGMVRAPGEGGRWWTLHVKGLPKIKFDGKRLEGAIKTIRVVRSALRVEVQFVCAGEVEVPEHSGGTVGVDMGVSKRMTLSDGSVVPRRMQTMERRKRLQRKLARAQKGSNNRAKKRMMLAKELARIREREIAADHQISTWLTQTYSQIALEDLRIANMTASGGSHKTGLNREILAQSWGRLAAQLTYKAESAGCELVPVDPKYTSQNCSFCHARRSNTSKTYDVFTCSACGMRADRDINAARNVCFRAFGPDTGGDTPWRRAEEDQHQGCLVSAQNSMPGKPCI